MNMESASIMPVITVFLLKFLGIAKVDPVSKFVFTDFTLNVLIMINPHYEIYTK